MTVNLMRRLIRLHQKAEQHVNAYTRLSREGGSRSEADRHLRKAEVLFSQISDLIKGSTPL